MYWETPQNFSSTPGVFPVTAFNGDLGVILWQESQTAASGSGNIRVSLAVKDKDNSWEKRGVIGGPYSFSGTQPSILSTVIDNQGRIIIAAAASSLETEILISDDRGKTFDSYRINNGAEVSVAPRIAVRSDGGYILFITRGNETSLSIFYALSQDCYNWTPFQPFVTEPGMQLNFLPSYASLGSVDYVVFQSFMGSTDSIPAFQLFIKYSQDSGSTWSTAARITNFQDTYTNTTASPDYFDNQRPYLSVQNNSLFLVWERRYRTGSPQIYSAWLNSAGAVTGIPEKINSADAYCNNPVAFNYKDNLCVVWFDNRRGQNRIFIAQRSGVNWTNSDLSGVIAGDASFGRPVVGNDGIYIFWQTTNLNISRIYGIFPDTSVNAPRLTAGNFSPGRRTRGDIARISWNVPPDSSGIMGFSYIWTMDENAVPDQEIKIYNQGDSASTNIQVQALEDGAWYFSVIARDYAGNWSQPDRIAFVRDTTPPPAAVMIQPAVDNNGYLVSNTFTLNWNAPPASDIAGYTWSLDYLGSASQFAGMENTEFMAAAAERFPGQRISAPQIRGTDTYVPFNNQDNGLWRFVVQAIDEAGNIGPVSELYFRTNKYIPHTYITWVDAAQDEQGILHMRILGRGFSDNGNISRITLEKAGDSSWHMDFYYESGDYSIVSDREISGISADGIEEGMYRIILEHPVRGIYSTDPIVSISETGTVKFGDYTNIWEPSWLLRQARSINLDTGFLVIIAILVLCILGLVISLRGIGETITESAALRLDAAALISGDFMPSEKKKRMATINKRGIGLRVKLASFTAVLVMVVVIMVSVPLYLRMIQTQRQTLLQGLWDRSRVLLEGLAANAKAYLPLKNVLELGFLPAQMNSIPEAKYVTITGFNPDTAIFDDVVWATNDPDISDKIDTAEMSPGVSRITDVLSPRLADIANDLNTRSRQQIGNLTDTINSLNQEAREIAEQAVNTNTQADTQRLDQIQATLRGLETKLNDTLSQIGSTIGSEPEFSFDELSENSGTEYILFKPVMYRQGSEDYYFRGLIRLDVSISSIIKDIADAQQNILQIISMIALAAIAIGIIGALLLSTIIILPIKRLVSHVEQIRDTEDKADLEGVDIQIKSHDEIAILGNTINEMTRGLVKAAVAASDLSIGKETQKKFIPLELDREGNKLSTGSKDTKNASFFGYYEGAKGVSGDYFDYQDLDGRYYAVIKCDVAGKGIPAALIMIQVATMFLNYFKQWKPTEKGMHIEDLVYQINDFIETLGFKGRFAAFTLCLFDSQTGIARFCNAGDNILHLYDTSQKKLVTITTPETPATGVLPNFLVESKGGYKVQSIEMDHGDVLMLYTDGIEEAKRKFRDSAFKEITCTEGPVDTPHENHSSGQDGEEMGQERVAAIVNAVMNRQVYTLHKWHNPEGQTDLTFDFSNCKGSEEDIIMAMVSVEKIFRCYKDPGATADARVLIDKKVDAFLKEHFLQYRNYCSYTKEIPGNNSYLYYTNMKEDDQYDDLTILGIRRK
ncbi:MAG: SpoIIE family protein phosphatase [Treponema sp.]|nr:SpoIIE family protein phosphatase [Treponema sp.]